MSLVRPLGLLVALLGLPGCTATFSMVRIADTGRVLHEAEDAGAAANAPYEYELALRHYHQSLEEHADAQYKTASDLAKIGRTWAEQAKAVAAGGARAVQEAGGAELTDEGSKAPGNTPKPSSEDDEDFLEEDEDK